MLDSHLMLGTEQSKFKVFLLLAFVYFLWRVPVRWYQNLSHYNDFSISYIDGRAWLKGINPYTAQSFLQEWREGAGLQEISEVNVATAFALPSAVPFIASVAWLPWIQVSTLLFLFSLAAFFAMIGALYELYGLGSWMPLAAFCLSLTAFHSSIQAQNIVALLIPFIVISLWMIRRGHEVAAGVLLGVGTCFKPQVVLIVVAFLFVKKHWKVCITCIGVVGVALSTFVALAQNGALAAFYQRLNTFAVNDPNDFAMANPARYEMLNLQLIPASLGLSRTSCNVIAWSICIALCLYWYFKTERAIEPIVMIGLLPFYHRYCDAGLLVLPIALMLKHRPRLAWLSLPFFAPVPVALYLRFGSHGQAWNSLVLCHQVWLLLGFSILLLFYTRSATAGNRITSKEAITAKAMVGVTASHI